jgi:hypothetical protein
MRGAELSYAARVALLSLRDRPDQDTPRQIASVPLGLSREDMATGLRELGTLGLAVESGGHWQLTREGSGRGHRAP